MLLTSSTIIYPLKRKSSMSKHKFANRNFAFFTKHWHISYDYRNPILSNHYHPTTVTRHYCNPSSTVILPYPINYRTSLGLVERTPVRWMSSTHSAFMKHWREFIIIMQPNKWLISNHDLPYDKLLQPQRTSSESQLFCTAAIQKVIFI